MKVEETVESIKSHKDSIIKGNAKKIFLRDAVTVTYSITIAIVFIFMIVTPLITPIRNILGLSDYLVFETMMFAILIFLSQTLFAQISKIPKLTFVYKIDKSDKQTLDKLTSNINNIIQQCFLKHKIIIHNVEISTLGDVVILIITFS